MGQKLTQVEEDPPGPQPWRCFQIGAATARAFANTPWKVALIASSSWSHSFLTEKHGRMYPDVESDKRYYEALRNGEWDTWRDTNLAQAEDRGITNCSIGFASRARWRSSSESLTRRCFSSPGSQIPTKYLRYFGRRSLDDDFDRGGAA